MRAFAPLPHSGWVAKANSFVIEYTHLVKARDIFFSLLVCALPTFGSGEVFHRTDELVTALRQGGLTDDTFDIVATVTYVSTNCADEKTNVAVKDLSGYVLIRAEDRSGMSTIPRRGAIARCRGSIMRNVYGRTFAVLTEYEETGVSPAPTPADLSCPELFDGRHDFMLCRFTGTLRDVAYNETDPYWLLLAICSHEGRVFATVPVSQAGDFHRLEKSIGSEISVTGICVPYDHSPRLQTGKIFKIAAMDFIDIHPRTAEDGDALPLVENIRMSQPSDVAMLGRHRASGHIVAAWQSNRALLKTRNGDFIGLEFAQKDRLPRYGEPVEAIDVSFPAANANATRAFVYEVRVTGEGEPLVREAVAEGFDQAADSEWANRPSRIVLAKSWLPKGDKLEIAVTPVSSLGVRGKAISVVRGERSGGGA